MSAKQRHSTGTLIFTVVIAAVIGIWYATLAIQNARQSSIGVNGIANTPESRMAAALLKTTTTASSSSIAVMKSTLASHQTRSTAAQKARMTAALSGGASGTPSQ